MDETFTHITIILDRTGSMASIRDDTIGGFNTFLDEQEKVSGAATITLVQFDTVDPYEVIYHFEPISEVAQLTHETYVPRASTPLYDAVGRGIIDLETQLAKLDDTKKPSKIVFVVVTDGQENSSKEFNKKQILEMVQRKETEKDWQFVYLSADLQSADESIDLGFMPQAVMAYDKTSAGTRHGWNSMSKQVSSFRISQKPDVSFDKEDRSKQESEGKRKKDN